jgi:hypothetical protein
MSILKAADAEGSASARFFYEYPALPGLGHFIHTYVCDGNPVIPTFQGEPERVTIPADIDAFTQELWNNLDENNKISLFVRYTDLQTRETQQRLINKHNDSMGRFIIAEAWPIRAVLKKLERIQGVTDKNIDFIIDRTLQSLRK